jgi:hypothetical protein
LESIGAVFLLSLILYALCIEIDLLITFFNFIKPWRASKRFAAVQAIVVTPQIVFFLPTGVAGLLNSTDYLCIIETAIGGLALVLFVNSIRILVGQLRVS